MGGDIPGTRGVQLAGGLVNVVRRVDDTVHRPRLSDYARQLLRHLGRHDWQHAPRLLAPGTIEDVLSFVPGRAALTPADQERAAADGALAGVARMVRELHDLTEGTDLAGASEVACHHDLDPRNTIYRRDADGTWEPVAIIDWDLASPGLRVQDLGHACWTFTGIGPGADVARSRRRIAVIVDAYEFDGALRDVVDAALWWQDRCWRGIQAEAAAGDPAKVALRDSGVVDRVRETYAWTREHRDALV
jgi:hypothetical protein